MNKEMYIDIIRHLKGCGPKETPPYNQRLISPSRQCSSTPVGFGQGFIIQE